MSRRSWWESPVVAGLGSLLVASCTLLGANAWLMSRANVTETTRYVWLVSPCAVLVLLLALGFWARTDRTRLRHLQRVALWAYAGALVLGLGGALNSYVQAVEGTSLTQTIEFFVGWSGGGLLNGGLVGIYDAERRIERERTERARRDAEQLATGLSVINRVLRHDLRNHVTVLEGQLQLVDADDSEAADTIRHHLDRIIELAEQARDMEAILRCDESTTIDAAHVVRRVTADVQEAYPQAQVSTDLPRTARVRAHKLLDTAVLQLVENAVVHDPDPDPTVEVTVSVGEEFVDITVSDEGPGIPDYELELRTQPVESALEHSNGLGLWLVDWYVDQSDGRLAIQSDEDGSDVTLSLPRAAGRAGERP